MTWLTETDPPYQDLERWEVQALLEAMNEEDATVPRAVRQALPALTAFIEAALGRLRGEGRLIYMGSGTSGRLGVLDAAECPPTFGVPAGKVIGLIAGGPKALEGPIEAAEDNEAAAIHDLKALGLMEKDVLFAISASGRTPYALAGVRYAREVGALTGGFCANPEAPLLSLVEHPILVVTGPEFITGSTRLKAGTATKLVLNMISTAIFIRLGHVKGTRMLDLQLVNQKLRWRATRYLMELGGLSEAQAIALLAETGGLRQALQKLGRL